VASSRRIIGFINIGHAIDHMFMLLFPTAVLAMQADFVRPYGELIALSLGGFIAFGAGSVPAGWLGDKWSRRNMMAVFFLGLGAATIATGLATSLWQVAAGLTAIGLFASIYHPVGTAMLVSHTDRIGREIGINGVCGNVGVASAALVTGAITEWLGWRWAFILPGAAALGIGAAYLALVPAVANRTTGTIAREIRFPRPVLARAFIVLALVTLAGGVVFNAATAALPKLIDERLPQLAGSKLSVGTLVCAIYLVGAVAQLIMGRLIDHHPLKVGFMAVAMLQAPLLLSAAYATGWPMVVVGGGIMFALFGQVTFNDGMVARYADDAWRARVYGIRYLLSFGVSAVAIPLTGFVYEHGGFPMLFRILSVFGLLVLLGALFFPYRRDELARFSPVAQSAD
jgi:MFS family permease